MSIYVTIDGGTTNTRLNLVCDKRVVDTVKLPIGAKASMTAREAFRASVKNAISELIARNALADGDVHRILASGMITSELGLYEVKHTLAPAGIRELSAAAKEVVLSDISPIPFVFMSGVKTVSEELEGTDMMRGEETELMGITASADGESVYILPGSHSKIIKTDGEGRITEFYTMLTGEMLSALSDGTILKDAVELSNSEINEEYLIKGYEYCIKNGINESLFKTRILKNLLGADRDECYSFFCGAVLCGEVSKTAELASERVVIGGRKQIKEALRVLLSRALECEVCVLTDEQVANSTVNGAIKIYEYAE